MLAGEIFVGPAASDAEVREACDVMVEAADWLASIGQPLWDRQALHPEKIRPAEGQGRVVLARIGGRPAGAFLLLNEDPLFWPDATPNEALYLHKLAVRRLAAGTGLSEALLDYAVEKVRAAGRAFLRLDCALRPKLFEFYESNGFMRHSDGTVGNFAIRRYQREVFPNETGTDRDP